MASVIQTNFRLRKTYGKTSSVVEVPNLIGIQKHSYDQFLQAGIPKKERGEHGLEAVFKSVFPIKDFNDTSSLEYVDYRFEQPKYDIEECLQRGMTYAAPVKVVVQLVVWDINEETEARSIRDVKEQEVFFGELPFSHQDRTVVCGRGLRGGNFQEFSNWNYGECVHLERGQECFICFVNRYGVW